MGEIYAAPRILKWSALELGHGVRLTNGKSEDGAIGFVPVYATREEYDRNYPDVEPLIFGTRQPDVTE